MFFATHEAPVLLQESTPFAQSLLWDLQRRYYQQAGKEAWRSGTVPSYVTCNPSMAIAYAEMCLALLQALPDTDTPIVLCELGAGSGRLAYLVMRHLERRCAGLGLPLDRFLYVMTDIAEANLDAWLAHPSLRRWLANGQLDVAHFDASAPGPLQLRHSARTILPGSQAQPVVILANYLFDSMPQDLYCLRGGQAYPCDLRLLSPTAGTATTADASATADLIARLQFDYAVRKTPAAPEDGCEAALLARYADELEGSFLLFPSHTMRCLAYLRSLSRAGMLVLSADKGDYTLESLRNLPPPMPERHGSVSLQVNFHALGAWAGLQGGIALMPQQPPASVGVCSLVLLQAGATAVQQAYAQHVAGFGPDEYYTLIRHLRDHQDQLCMETILAALRLGRGDAHLLGRLMPRLQALAEDMQQAQLDALAAAAETCWDHFFPLGEDFDWCAHLGYVFHLAGAYALALRYYQRSADLHGETADTLFNALLCHLGREDGAAVARIRARLSAMAPDYPGLAELSGK